MEKQNQKIANYFQDYLIPHIKNKLDRNVFSQKLHQWLCKKLQKVVIKDKNLSNLASKDLDPFRKQQCKQLQKQLHLKFSIEDLIYLLPIHYYETLIHYVIQKKLFWIFKPQNQSERQALLTHKQLQVSLALKLKEYYKKIELGESLFQQNTREKFENQKIERSSARCNKIKKQSFDFQYQLLLMYSLCMVASFFQYFFTELSIDNSFKSQIYIIINHAFLDLQVSPNVFQIMRKKFLLIENEKNFQSLNACYVHEKSISQHKSKQSKLERFQESKRTIFQEKKKSSFAYIKQSMHTIQSEEQRELHSKGINPVSISRLNSTVGFSSLGSVKTIGKKGVLLNQACSINHSTRSARQSQLPSKQCSMKKPNQSRLNSFMKDSKKLSIHPIIEENLCEDYLPSVEQMEFSSTVRKCLHVDSLPTIIRKKMNINQYEKLNEIEQIKDIRKEVKSLDASSRKNHIKSNQLSLAMDTFISFSSAIPKKKRVKKNIQVVTNPLLKQQNLHQQTCNDQKNAIEQYKYNFQLIKLPLKASILKLQYQKSAGFYKFNNQLQNNSQNQKEIPILSNLNSSISLRKLHKPENKFQDNRSFKQQVEFTFQDTIKKTSSEWKTYIQQIKGDQRKAKIMTFNQEGTKNQRKKTLENQTYPRHQMHSYTHLITPESLTDSYKLPIHDSISDLNKLPITTNPQFLEVLNGRGNRQSTLGELSSRLQLYELGTRDVSQGEEMIQSNAQNQENFNYSSLDGQVNVRTETSTDYKSIYKSFDLKRKLRDFESNCKVRDQKAHYSIFKLKNYKNLSQQNNETNCREQKSNEKQQLYAS